MKTKLFLFLVIIVLQSIVASGQETQKNKLRLNIPVLDGLALLMSF